MRQGAASGHSAVASLPLTHHLVPPSDPQVMPTSHSNACLCCCYRHHHCGNCHSKRASLQPSQPLLLSSPPLRGAWWDGDVRVTSPFWSEGSVGGWCKSHAVLGFTVVATHHQRSPLGRRRRWPTITTSLGLMCGDAMILASPPGPTPPSDARE